MLCEIHAGGSLDPLTQLPSRTSDQAVSHHQQERARSCCVVPGPHQPPGVPLNMQATGWEGPAHAGGSSCAEWTMSPPAPGRGGTLSSLMALAACHTLMETEGWSKSSSIWQMDQFHYVQAQLPLKLQEQVTEFLLCLLRCPTSRSERVCSLSQEPKPIVKYLRSR